MSFAEIQLPYVFMWWIYDVGRAYGTVMLSANFLKVIKHDFKARLITYT